MTTPSAAKAAVTSAAIACLAGAAAAQCGSTGSCSGGSSLGGTSSDNAKSWGEMATQKAQWGSSVTLVADREPDDAASSPAADDMPPITRVVGQDLGDPEPRETREGTGWVYGRHVVRSPLPVGYPRPTPPGAIELKRYPVVRRAEVSADIQLMPELGSNMGFFPLFRHIQSRDIAMTSPVEMDYPAELFPQLELPEVASGDTWTMSFLYREIEQGPAGEDPRDQRVTVRDAEPILVLAAGVAGPYGRSTAQPGFESLIAWLDENPQWEIAGQPRVFHYNGPSVPNRLKWSEAQLPIRRVAADSDTEAKAETPKPANTDPTI